jgi:Uma2 family endonuclease
LLVRLYTHARSHALGLVVGADVGFVLARDPDVVYAPDVAFIRADRVPYGAAAKKFIEGAPDLVVEVVSPNDRWPAVKRKVDKFLKAGARLVWVVRPNDRTVVVRDPDGRSQILGAFDTLDGQEVVPGFRFRVGDLFAL